MPNLERRRWRDGRRLNAKREGRQRRPGRELASLATHCTRQEGAANKVERQMRKSEAALVLDKYLGEIFDGIVTGSSNGNTWVRIFLPPAEGKLLVAAGDRVKVGERVRARLLSTDVERGFIDFELVCQS